MKKGKIVYAILIGFFLMGTSQNVQGQFLKKLKKQVEGEIEKLANEEMDGVLNGKETETSTQEKDAPQTKTAQKSEVPKNNGSIPLEQKNNAPKANAPNTLTYKAPSANFIDVTIQSHNGLPRYGEIYYKRGETGSSYNAYKALVELKYLKEAYSDMDHGKLTSNEEEKKGDQKLKNSRFAQQNLLRLAGHVCSEAVLKQYFCEPSSSTPKTTKTGKAIRTIPCEFVDNYGNRTPPGYWGGSRNNQFQQMRSYKGFVDNHLDNLQKWAETFYDNDEQVVYYVSRSGISGKYDFKKKGYWLSGLIRGGVGDFMLHSSNFLAYTENEKKIKHSSEKFFFAMDPAKAKEANLQDRSPVFCVFKVKVLPKTSNQTRVQFEFELVDQTIEVYSKDPALIHKLGEIDLNDLQSKN